MESTRVWQIRVMHRVYCPWNYRIPCSVDQSNDQSLKSIQTGMKFNSRRAAGEFFYWLVIFTYELTIGHSQPVCLWYFSLLGLFA